MTIVQTPPQYRFNWQTLYPEPYIDGTAGEYISVIATLRDLLVEKATQAVAIRLPGLGDPSQLPFLAHDKSLDQGPGESNASFVKRLSTAPASWKRAGAAVSVLEQLQAYLQGLQPGVAGYLPEMAVVLDTDIQHTTWSTIYNGDAIGADPSRATVNHSNFDWDGQHLYWRAWLVLYMHLVPLVAGSGAQVNSVAPSACFTNPGQNVNGVWVPATSGTPVNDPWITISGLSGRNSSDVGRWLTLSGSSILANNGTFPIVSVTSSSVVVIANPNGVAPDASTMNWAVSAYPFFGPGPVWGAPGYTFGQGATPNLPPIDTGSNAGGVWSPTPASSFGCTLSWGLTCPSTLIGAIRAIVKKRKSASTYYPNFVFTFDNGTGSAGSEYSPNSSPGAGNPDGSFGPVGRNVAGVWVPTRLLTSSFDCYTQGTGSYSNCSVENVN